jgi:lambda family phage portal protein
MANFVERVAARLGYFSRSAVSRALVSGAVAGRTFRRSYDAGNVNRLSAEFMPAQVSEDTDLVRQLRLMRLRSRALFKNESYGRRYSKLIQKNVIGPAGVQLSVLGSDDRADGLLLSKADAAAIEKRWRAWGCSSWVTTDRRSTWRQVQRLAAVNAAREGESFCRLVVSAANPYLLSLQFLVADQFDEQFNSSGSGTEIRLAIETEVESGERVAYWPFRRDPGDMYGGAAVRSAGQRVRIGAREMVHWFMPEFVRQTRGVPWLFSAIPQLNMLNGYAESELVASRVAASKMGFFIPPEGGEYTGDGTDAAGNTITEVAPGMMEELAPGTKLETFDPQHPNANFSAFQTAMLRGTAAGGDVSYQSLSGDLTKVNYSSARIGLLDERDGFAVVQDEFISGFCAPIFRAWLVGQATLGLVPMTPAQAAGFDEVIWRPRRWSWVDPQKEINAAAAAVALRIKSRTQICAEMGDNFLTVAAELAAEQKVLEALGIPPEASAAGGSVGQGQEPDPEEDEEKPEEDEEDGTAAGVPAGRINGRPVRVG